jgi:hypothetical protein
MLLMRMQGKRVLVKVTELMCILKVPMGIVKVPMGIVKVAPDVS